MQITLNQDEIVDAITNYVRGQIAITSNQQIAVDLRAGRGENGFTATLDIRPIDNATVGQTGVRKIDRPSSEDLDAKTDVLAGAPTPNASPAPTSVVNLPKAKNKVVEKPVEPDPAPEDKTSVEDAAVDEAVDRILEGGREIASEPEQAVPPTEEPAPATMPARKGSIFNFAKPAE